MFLKHLLIKPQRLLTHTPLSPFSLFNNFNAKKDYYSILGIDKKASTKQVKQAFYSLAKQYHPDVSKGTEEKFKDINEANNVLSDEKTRKQYDQVRAFGDFRRKFTTRGNRARRQAEQEGFGQYGFEYNPENFNWRAYYNQMSSEDQVLVNQRLRAIMVRLAVLGVGFIASLFIFFKKPAQFYGIGDNGELTPIYNKFGMPGATVPNMRDQYGERILPVSPMTHNSNPYGMNAPNNQYNPYNEYFTQNPNKHPYSPT